MARAPLKEGMRVRTPKGDGVIIAIDQGERYVGFRRWDRYCEVVVRLDGGGLTRPTPLEVEPVPA